MEKHRLLAMTDGVVAIIITIMGEERFARSANEMVRGTISSDERREPQRAAGGRA
jgi:hypothetical protein